MDEIQLVKAIDTPQIQQAIKTLERYKSGKSNLENKIIENEQFWKLRHWEQMRSKKWVPATAYLWNAITSKHADMQEAYPEPNILPREEGDKGEAEKLSSIIPVILEQNEFRKTWSECAWYKLKQGASIYNIYWDKTKNGIGDISIRMVDALNLFWEPGIKNLQDSRNIFYTELVDNDVLEAMYPQLQGKLSSGGNMYVAKYLYDDTVDTTEKSTVIEWYYHKMNAQGKKILHYCKFCGEQVLYATENETQPPMAPITDPMTQQPVVDEITGQPAMKAVAPAISETGLFDHGMYPFVMDTLYAIEGTPFGYGMTDIFKDTQINIDQLNRASIKSSLMGATPRFFVREDANINLENFADWENEIVPVQGRLDEESIRSIDVTPLSGVYIDIMNNQIEMLKETSGNRDVNQGGAPAGVTAASAIAALQEQGQKASKDLITSSYEAYKQVVIMVLELIRQFYDVPRQFRIIGNEQAMQFVTFDNSGIKPQEQGTDFGLYMGARLPLFDINVQAQKATSYSKISQNELMIQFAQLGFFQPENATPARACIEGMDFLTKQDVLKVINQNDIKAQATAQMFQMLMQMAQYFDPKQVPMVTQLGIATGALQPGQMPMPQQAPQSVQEPPETDSLGGLKGEEHPFVRRAREQAQAGAQPS